MVLATRPRSSTGVEQVDEPLKLVVEPHAVAVHVAGAGERVGDFEELLGGEHGADGGAAGQQADVVQARRTAATGPGRGRRPSR